jgi:hypothetical protein
MKSESGDARFWDRPWVEAVQIALNLIVAGAFFVIIPLAYLHVVGAWLVGVLVGCGFVVALINHASHGPDDELPDY